MKRIALALTALLAFVSCGDSPTTPDAPNGITITITNTQTQGGGDGPNGTASPQPGGPTLPPGSYVSIGVFGRSCPSGITDVPAGVRQFRVGCLYDVTATPRGPDQKELGIEVTGPIAVWAQPVPAGLGAVTVQENSYNITFRAGPGTGPVTLCASVKGTQGCGDYTVVQ